MAVARTRRPTLTTRRPCLRGTPPRAEAAAAPAAAPGHRAPARVRKRILRLQGLTVRYGGVTAVNGVDLEVAAGEIVGLIGPNGAGKTSLIDAVSGFTKPSSGLVLLDDVDLLKY